MMLQNGIDEVLPWLDHLIGRYEGMRDVFSPLEPQWKAMDMKAQELASVRRLLWHFKEVVKEDS